MIMLHFTFVPTILCRQWRALMFCFNSCDSDVNSCSSGRQAVWCSFYSTISPVTNTCKLYKHIFVGFKRVVFAELCKKSQKFTSFIPRMERNQNNNEYLINNKNQSSDKSGPATVNSSHFNNFCTSQDNTNCYNENSANAKTFICACCNGKLRSAVSVSCCGAQLCRRFSTSTSKLFFLLIPILQVRCSVFDKNPAMWFKDLSKDREPRQHLSHSPAQVEDLFLIGSF